ncbi:hypothetical protein ER308_11955 [Egibacter rhizosphaerae]|uniref:L,D-TPase catalytic domain-containing protein n=1 Tax=Egibacter rhizosphaerae TaxID=1670831 RepID=A0A411YGA6_9ACTN|nr:L,D-transpeptidase family protein [Egibacter rhizosphaerae]QBI20209.1 hypothetical protein ER308_11955 [Egibacter rhizosphaerae]
MGVRGRASRVRTAVVAVIGGSIAVIVAMGVAVVALAHQEFDSGRLLAGTTIAGVDVEGLAPTEAVDVVAAHLLDDEQPLVTVEVDDRQWPMHATEALDADALSREVADAIETSHARFRELSPFGMVSARWLGRSPGIAVDVRLPTDRDGVDAFVRDVAGEVDEAAVDAEIAVVDGWMEFRAERTGRDLDRVATSARVREAVKAGEAEVTGTVRTVQPQRTLDEYADVLLVRQGDRRLYHYVDGEIEAEWPVAVGAGGSPTPTGRFVVGAKRASPTWHNPAADGWGEDMPEVIDPGPDNPLGLRALNWLGEDGADTLVRFHGTADGGSIGQAASRGCVRLSNEHVIELFDRVPQGATIISI